MSNYLINIGKKSKKAFENNLIDSHFKKKIALNNFNQKLRQESNNILFQNSKDLKYAKNKKIKENLIDRLLLNKKRIEQIRYSINEITKFKDPVGKIVSSWKRPNGLIIKKITIPIGVIGVIFESRPNVACDISALCLNQVIMLF